MFALLKLQRLSRQIHIFNVSVCSYSEQKNPFYRTLNVISKEIPDSLGFKKRPPVYPEHADIVIIGGGLIGSSVAFWLKSRAGEGLNVVVLEKEPTFEDTLCNKILGTITQHYSLLENMQLSLYGADFLRNVKQHLGQEVDIQYYPHGHLILASEQYAEILKRNVSMQREHRVMNELLTIGDIKEKFPWVNTNDIKLGCMGLETEGVFNGHELHKAFINKSQGMGACYIKAEVIGFELEHMRDLLMEGIAPGTYKKIKRVIYKTAEGEFAIKFAGCILAAGHNSGEIAKLANIGAGQGLLSIPLPVVSKRQKVYTVTDIGITTGLNTPLITDTSGLWLRKRDLKSSLLCGHVFLNSLGIEDPLEDDFQNITVKHAIQNRISICIDPKLTDAAIELFDVNKFDDTGILGPHPYYNNLYIATGFGKNGSTWFEIIPKHRERAIIKIIQKKLQRKLHNELTINAASIHYHIPYGTLYN